MPLQVLLIEDSPAMSGSRRRLSGRPTATSTCTWPPTGSRRWPSSGRKGSTSMRRPRSHPPGPQPSTDGRPRGPRVHQGGREPQDDPDRHPDYVAVGIGRSDELRAPGECVPQQARRAGRLRKPRAEHPRLLAEGGGCRDSPRADEQEANDAPAPDRGQPGRRSTDPRDAQRAEVAQDRPDPRAGAWGRRRSISPSPRSTSSCSTSG